MLRPLSYRIFVVNVRLSAKRRRASSEPPAVFFETRPTAVIDTPLGQSQYRDGVNLVGDLRSGILLRGIDDDQQRTCSSAVSDECLLKHISQVRS